MRVVKLNKLNTNILIAVTATVLLLTHLGEAGAVSAAPDQYDPRRDPNYSREAFQTAPIHWEAVWGLVREFEVRSHSNAARSQPSSQFAVLRRSRLWWPVLRIRPLVCRLVGGLASHSLVEPGSLHHESPPASSQSERESHAQLIESL
jgi:hypothetical protein